MHRKLFGLGLCHEILNQLDLIIFPQQHDMSRVAKVLTSDTHTLQNCRIRAVRSSLNHVITTGKLLSRSEVLNDVPGQTGMPLAGLYVHSSWRSKKFVQAALV